MEFFSACADYIRGLPACTPMLLCPHIHICKFALPSLHLYMKEGEEWGTRQWFIYQAVSQMCVFHKWLTCGLVISTDSITQLIQEHGKQFVTTSVRFKVETFVFWFLYPQWVFWSRCLMIITLPLLPLLYSIWIFILYIFKYVYTYTHIYTEISTTFICLYICVCLYIYTYIYLYLSMLEFSQ